MILITGSTSGIGEACAQLFAEKKHPLFLLARNLHKLELQKKDISEKYGVEVCIAQVDIQQTSEIENFFTQYAEKLSKVNTLINNAGLAKGLGPTQSLSFSDISAMIDTNFRSLVFISKMMIPIFIANKVGHIINIGSVAGHHVYPNGNVYCATKSAVHAMTQGLRYDLHGTGIRVSEVSPGLVNTNFSTIRLGDKQKADLVYAGMMPLSAQDIAETVLWICERPKHVNIEEVVIYPTAQVSPYLVDRKI